MQHWWNKSPTCAKGTDACIMAGFADDQNLHLSAPMSYAIDSSGNQCMRNHCVLDGSEFRAWTSQIERPLCWMTGSHEWRGAPEAWPDTHKTITRRLWKSDAPMMEKDLVDAGVNEANWMPIMLDGVAAGEVTTVAQSLRNLARSSQNYQNDTPLMEVDLGHAGGRTESGASCAGWWGRGGHRSGVVPHRSGPHHNLPRSCSHQRVVARPQPHQRAACSAAAGKAFNSVNSNHNTMPTREVSAWLFFCTCTGVDCCESLYQVMGL